MLRMLDSITPANLPPGADAYLGYVDGHWANYPAVKARFPQAHILSMAVFASEDAEGADCETGDMMPAQIPGWVKRQQARGVHRPVVYASASVIPAVLAALAGAGIARADVRLLSAHYAGEHICGPATCAYPGVPACDGTQWSDTAPGAGGSKIDESALLDDFFQEAPMAAVDLTPAALTALAKAVWSTDGLIANPNGNPANRFWTGAEILADTDQRVRAVQVSLAALVGEDDPAALAKAILAGLDPASIAAAVVASVGPEVAGEVVSELETLRLGK